MPYVKLTPKERQEARRKAFEKSLETRRARSLARGRLVYIKIPQPVLERLNAVSISYGMTQIDTVTMLINSVALPAITRAQQVEGVGQ